MAAMGELKKSARIVLGDYMNSRGLREGSRCSYFRITEDGVIHLITIVPIISGKQARVWVTCTVPELVENFDIKRFPKDGVAIYVGGYMSDLGIGRDFGKAMIDSVESRERFLASLPEYFDKWAFPFFDRIKTRQNFWNEMNDENRDKLTQRGMKMDILGMPS